MINNLPSITFVNTDPETIESSIITLYENISGKTLFPGDPIRLFLSTIAVLIIQQRLLIDYSAKQNLLAFAAGDNLDHLGVLVGTTRLPASNAQTTLRFTLSAAQSQTVTIPPGTRATPGNNLFFATTAAATILAGQTTIDVAAECTEEGEIGNNFQPGQINKIVDPFQWFQSVTNITASEGGADIESDDAYRDRIQQAPEQFSTAGPSGAYKYWAMTANQSIIDVSVSSPTPGTVEIRPLLTGGEIPGQEILDDVDAVCNDKKMRPLTDLVTVLAPATVSYNVDLTYYIDKENTTIAASIQDAVTTAVNDYVLWQKSKLGRDINPSELIARIMKAGARRVNVTSPVFTTLTVSQVAMAGTITATYGGLEDD